MLSKLPVPTDPNLLVGHIGRDDAAVYRLDDDTALVFTTDFFTPIVDDPFDFGRIAAANALSDVYAMGARPLLALNLVGFPAKKLPLSVLGDILAGGAAVLKDASVALAGGHSIDDNEPKYGLAVIGIAHPDHIVRNSGALPGDRLVLTKPLGIGVTTTAIKRGLASAEDIKQVTELMTALNKPAAAAMAAHRPHVHAATDVTGYGLLGHLLELLDASGVAAELDHTAIPILDAARGFATQGIAPGGSTANLAHVEPRTTFDDSIDAATRLLLADAQTSGGLLIAIAAEHADALVTTLAAEGTPAQAIIGTIVAGEPSVSVR